jgi:hypothetical protein
MIKKCFFNFILFCLFTSTSAQNLNTNALHFDGVDDVVSTASNISALNITGNITIEAWIKISSNTSQYARIIGRGDATYRTYGLWIGNPANQNRILWQIYGDGTPLNLMSATTLSLNTWYHIAVIRSTGGDAKMYINGVLDNSSTGNTVTPHSTTFPTKIGYGDANVYFPGTIDDVRIWNVVRTATEINDNKNVQISTATGLVASYHFNQGTASGSNSGVTTLSDASGNNYSGTLSGFSLSGSTSNWVSSGVTLPVAWQSFTAVKQPNIVELNWSTASEQNTKDFEVQYSTNTQDWSVLGTVAAAGNSSTTKEFNFTHNSPLKGSIYNYYRIKQNDLDDKFSYSKIVSIIYNEPGPDVQLYPNPVKDIITIYLAESQQLRLVNMAGATVWQGFKTAGRTQLSVSHLPKGVYMLLTLKGPQQILIQ